MSYDIYVGGESFNYTSNVAKLFYDHIPALEDGGRGGLDELHGKTGKAATAILKDAFDRIHLSYLKDWTVGEVGSSTFSSRYDPPNGWGSTVGALIFLAQVMAACASNPRKKVRLWA